MGLAAVCFIGMLVAAAEHAGAAAIVLLVLFVVLFLTSWTVLIVGVLRLKRDVSQLVRERQQSAGR